MRAPHYMQNTNYDGALEHIALNFGQWAQRLIRARKRHLENTDTKDATRKSGGNTGKHGLTQEELRYRVARKKARIDYYWTKELDSQILAYKGEGKSKGSKYDICCNCGKKGH